jgi:SAM-dependent methyltransferase
VNSCAHAGSEDGSELTRQFYDQSPYPPPCRAGSKRWKLAPMDWILSIDRVRNPIPRRLLVAGCGTGSEAFLLQDVLKDAEIVAVDFSLKSIRIARQSQAKSLKPKRIRFIQADLTQPDFRRQIGGDFDLIVCHGVLSYLPQPASTLRTLAECLRPDGLLYLGVNGASHFSASLRPVLARLGFDVAKMPRSDRWRRLLKMWEAVEGGSQSGPLTRLPDWYLGGDFFGPVLHSLRLDQWTELFCQAGLFLRASVGAHHALRPMIASEATSLLMPRSRAEVCELLDLMHPASFHRLILSRQPTPNPPWADRAQLLSWRPARTDLYRISYPQQTKRTGFRSVTVLKSRPLGTQFEWPMPRWEVEVLRRCDGSKPLGQLLREIGRGASTAQFSEQLFLLYQFAVLNFFPP